MKKKWNNSALNCEAYSFFPVCSPITAKIQLSLRRNAARITAYVLYNRSRLNRRDTCDKYTLTLRNKFDAIQKISEIYTPNNEYKNFVNAHTEATAESIPTEERAKRRVPWETLAVRKSMQT